MKKWFPAWAVIALAATCSAGSSRSSLLDQPEGTLSYIIKLQSAPVGVLTEAWETLPEGRQFHLDMELELSRMGVPIKMSMTQETVESPDGRIKLFDSELNASQMSSRTRGEVRGDTIYWTSESFGYTESHRLPWPEGGIGTGSANWITRDSLVAGREEFTLEVFDPEKGEFNSLRIVNRGLVTDTISGRPGEFLRLEQFEGDADVASSVSLLDEDYVPVRTTMQLLAMTIVIERTADDRIDNIELPGTADIIGTSMLRMPVYPVPPDQLQDITLSITFPSALSRDHSFDAPNQKVVRREDNQVDLMLSRTTVNFETMSGDEASVYLQPDRFIQSDHPDIRSRAEAIRRETQTEGFDLAQAMAEWVNGYIAKKDYGTGFASALEVLNDRTGDCSEHSVLLVALLRAAGIPARVVSGLAYQNGNLIGHMWAEAYVDYWRTVDALDLDLDPIRIRLSASRDSRALGMEDMTAEFSILNGVVIQVLGYAIRQEMENTPKGGF